MLYEKSNVHYKNHFVDFNFLWTNKSGIMNVKKAKITVDFLKLSILQH